MTIQLTPDQFEAAQRQSQRRKGQRPSDPAEEERDRQIGGLKIDYSGLDVKRMWHAQGSRDRVGMEFVERLDSVLPDWVDPSELQSAVESLLPKEERSGRTCSAGLMRDRADTDTARFWFSLSSCPPSSFFVMPRQCGSSCSAPHRSSGRPVCLDCAPPRPSLSEQLHRCGVVVVALSVPSDVIILRIARVVSIRPEEL